MGLKSNIEGMEKPGHKWGIQVSLMEKQKSNLKNRKAFIFLNDPAFPVSREQGCFYNPSKSQIGIFQFSSLTYSESEI